MDKRFVEVVLTVTVIVEADSVEAVGAAIEKEQDLGDGVFTVPAIEDFFRGQFVIDSIDYASASTIDRGLVADHVPAPHVFV